MPSVATTNQVGASLWGASGPRGRGLVPLSPSSLGI